MNKYTNNFSNVVLLVVITIVGMSDSIADIITSEQYVDFYDLRAFDKSLTKVDELAISIDGFFLIDGTDMYLCNSMGTCYSQSYNRIKLEVDKSLNANDIAKLYEAYFSYNKCHVGISGIYNNYIDKPYMGYGTLKVSSRPGIKMGTTDYKELNNKCAKIDELKKIRGTLD